MPEETQALDFESFVRKPDLAIRNTIIILEPDAFGYSVHRAQLESLSTIELLNT